MKFNREIFDKAFTYVLDHPERWDQATYGRSARPEEQVCGTMGCIAFHICEQNGYVPVFGVKGVDGCECQSCNAPSFQGVMRSGGTGEIEMPGQVASRLLFGDENASHDMWAAANTLSDLYRMANQFEQEAKDYQAEAFNDRHAVL